MKKVAMKGPTKERMISMSNFFSNPVLNLGMKAPKIHLSAAETELMKDAAIILTKNAILEKVRLLLMELQEAQLERAAGFGPVFSVAPKVSRGENYLGLPYLVLDYPRLSGDDGLFFVRSFFWWGNFFSTTLHLSGLRADHYRAAIANAHDRLREYSAGTGSDPWVHHLGPEHYKKIGDWTEAEYRQWCADAGHIKIARAVPLDEWNIAVERLMEQWTLLLDVCGLVA